MGFKIKWKDKDTREAATSYLKSRIKMHRRIQAVAPHVRKLILLCSYQQRCCTVFSASLSLLLCIVLVQVLQLKQPWVSWLVRCVTLQRSNGTMECKPWRQEGF